MIPDLALFGQCLAIRNALCLRYRIETPFRLIAALGVTVLLVLVGQAVLSQPNDPARDASDMTLFVPFVAIHGSGAHMIDLGTLAGDMSVAQGINNLGQAVGFAGPAFSDHKAILWDNGVLVNLAIQGRENRAWAVNDPGQVVGVRPIDSDDRAFLWEDGVMSNLGTLGGRDSWAYAINDLGQVVGSSEHSMGSFSHHAFMWEDGVLTDLGTLGDDRSTARDINNLGQVVGWRETVNGERHAFIWKDGLMIDLGTLETGGFSSTAQDINDQGQVVGRSYTELHYLHAFLWSP